MIRLPKKLMLALKIGLALFAAAGLAFGALLAYVLLQQRSYARLADTGDLRQRIDALGGAYVRKRPQAALVIGVLQRGRRHVAGFGRLNATNPAPPDATTVFEIGSVTKVFTAVALARLSADQVVKLDDPIAACLPANVKVPQKDGQAITLRHLATHASGLPRLPNNLDAGAITNPYAAYQATDLYACLATVKLAGAPGRPSGYSNLGFGLLGHLLERRAGKPYEQLVKDLICQPLGMSNTSIRLAEAQQARLTPGHNPKGKVVPNWDFAVLAPAGAFRSTAADLLEFLAANLAPDDSPIGKALRETHRRQIDSFGGDCGLGWQIAETIAGLKILWHNGGTGGYVSFIGFNPEHQTAVAVLSNYGDAMAGDSATDRIGMEILKLASKVSLAP